MRKHERQITFPDREEITGSKPVRPTPFFEILSSAESQDGSQAPAVLPNKRWSRRWHSGASAQGVPAVSVSSKPIAADAIEYGNHAASRTSRVVNAARYAHIADSVLEACLGAFTATRRQPVTTCQHFPGGQALAARANGEEGLRARGRHPGGQRRVVHSPVHY
jgi:hypothetical protein